MAKRAKNMEGGEMARRLIETICAAGCWVCMIYAAQAWGAKAWAVVAITMILQAILTVCVISEAEEDECKNDDQAREE